MRPFIPLALAGSLSAAVLFAACGGGGGPRRTLNIVQADAGCTPATIAVTAGEQVTLAVKNNAKADWEIEGIEGTKIEEVLVPSGRSRNIDYSVPSKAGTAKIKCYTPGGASTIIELTIS